MIVKVIFPFSEEGIVRDKVKCVRFEGFYISLSYANGSAEHIELKRGSKVNIQ